MKVEKKHLRTIIAYYAANMKTIESIIEQKGDDPNAVAVNAFVLGFTSAIEYVLEQNKRKNVASRTTTKVNETDFLSHNGEGEMQA